MIKVLWGTDLEANYRLIESEAPEHDQRSGKNEGVIRADKEGN
jgi:hypothetical protein